MTPSRGTAGAAIRAAPERRFAPLKNLPFRIVSLVCAVPAPLPSQSTKDSCGKSSHPDDARHLVNTGSKIRFGAVLRPRLRVLEKIMPF